MTSELPIRILYRVGILEREWRRRCIGLSVDSYR
jgi:hypothetical protein